VRRVSALLFEKRELRTSVPGAAKWSKRVRGAAFSPCLGVPCTEWRICHCSLICARAGASLPHAALNTKAGFSFGIYRCTGAALTTITQPNTKAGISFGIYRALFRI